MEECQQAQLVVQSLNGTFFNGRQLQGKFKAFFYYFDKFR